MKDKKYHARQIVKKSLLIVLCLSPFSIPAIVGIYSWLNEKPKSEYKQYYGNDIQERGLHNVIMSDAEKALQNQRWNSYGEHKFVVRARQELGWEASLRGDELLKRAYNTENPERMLQALKDAQFNLNRSIDRAMEGR